MIKIKWTDRITNEEVCQKVKEERVKVKVKVLPITVHEGPEGG